jgi:uncharacterized protein YgiM (DUF1202 family)
MKTSIWLLFTLIFFSSDKSINFIESGCCGTCYGYSNCTACKNCNYCKHCNSGGTCGVCSGGQKSSSSYTPSTRSRNNQNSIYSKSESVVWTTKLNVRELPTTDSKVLITLVKGHKVKVLEDVSPSWSLIETKVIEGGYTYLVTGYVYKKYLQTEYH